MTELRHTCKDCSRPFTKHKSLLRHQRTVHGSTSAQSIRCAICGLTFKRRDIRNRHCLEQHENGSPATQCSGCGLPYRGRSLDAHLLLGRCRRQGSQQHHPVATLPPVTDPQLASMSLLVSHATAPQPLVESLRARSQVLKVLQNQLKRPIAMSNMQKLCSAVSLLAVVDHVFMKDRDAGATHVAGLIQLQRQTNGRTRLEMSFETWFALVRHFGLEADELPQCTPYHSFRLMQHCRIQAFPEHHVEEEKGNLPYRNVQFCGWNALRGHQDTSGCRSVLITSKRWD
jgi:hypothetical protein